MRSDKLVLFQCLFLLFGGTGNVLLTKPLDIKSKEFKSRNGYPKQFLPLFEVYGKPKIEIKDGGNKIITSEKHDFIKCI